MTNKTKKLVQRPKKLKLATTAPWMEKDKSAISPETIAAYRKEVADRHAQRAVQERNQRNLNQTNKVQVDNNEAKAEGVVQDANKVQVEKALKWYGISNGLGQMSNVPDQNRNTVSFGNFSGQESLRPIKTAALLGPVLAAPSTALYGFATSTAGGHIGKNIGKKLGNEQAGEIAGSFLFPTMMSGFNAATRPLLQRAFSNNFSDAFGYDQLLRIPPMLRDYGRGLIGKGPKKHPVITSTEDELSVTAERNGKPVKDVLDYNEGVYGYAEDRNLIWNKNLKDHLGNPREPNTFDVQKSINRAQAVSKYAGATDAETPLYLKNKSGSYQYNMEENAFKPHQTLNSSINGKEVTAVDEMQRAMDSERPIVTLDFLGGNGGNVGLEYTGQFMHNGEPYHRFMMRDLWDLHPIAGLGNAAAHLLSYNPYIKYSGPRALLSKVGKYAPIIPNTIRKVANSPILNREVGRIVGGKPFMLEHPFAVSDKALRTGKGFNWRTGTLNIFNNKEVPGAQYTTKESWDLPFNLGITERNLTYPLFNSWKLSQDTSSYLQQF